MIAPSAAHNCVLGSINTLLLNPEGLVSLAPPHRHAAETQHEHSATQVTAEQDTVRDTVKMKQYSSDRIP